MIQGDDRIRQRVTLVGNANVDIVVHPVAAIPDPGTEQLVETIEMRVGGAAAISALALAALGVAPRLIACVGADPLGSLVRDGLHAGRVAVNDVGVRSGERTAISIAFESPGRDRSYLIELGCLAGFDEELIPHDAVRADAVMISGYFLAPRLRGNRTERILRDARQNGALTFFDTGWDPDGWPTATTDEVRALLPAVDVFVPNLDEATALTGSHDTERAARALQEISRGLVVVKLGADGCVAASDSFVLHVDAPEVDVIDRTGAGDAFNAGLIASLIDGAALREALTFATRVGSSVVSRRSADRYAPPSELP